VLGAGLFVLFGLVGTPSEAPKDRIMVSAAKIENLAQLFERTWRRPPTAAELDGLIEDLYREALALGLDQDDFMRVGGRRFFDAGEGGAGGALDRGLRVAGTGSFGARCP
jgi:hypothetical protein